MRNSTHAILTCIALVFGEESANSQVVQLQGTNFPVADCRVRFQFRQALATDQAGILESRFSEGQCVKKGEVCARLRDGITRARYEIAAARAKSTGRAERARQAAVAAKLEFDLVVQANAEASGTFPESEVQRRKTALRLAELDTTVEEEELSVMRLQEQEEQERLESLQIRSEIDGVVVRSLKNPGESIQPGESIIEIVNPRQVQIEGYLPEEIASSVSVGDVVRIFSSDVDKNSEHDTVYEIAGNLVFVDVSIQPVSKSVRFLAQLENTRQVLREGMTIDVHVYPIGRSR